MIKQISGLILCALLGVGCATKYKTWQGGGVEVGQGGAMETVDGLEVWSHGRPNRPYRVVGLIVDSRPGGVIPMTMRAKAVAREAKAKGADGLIVIEEGADVMGTYNTMNSVSTLNSTSSVNANTRFSRNGAYTNGQINTTGTLNTFGSGMSMPVLRAHGTYQVFRYVTGNQVKP